MRAFSYATATKWTGERGGMVGSDGKPDLVVSSPPEFKGIPGVWTPEDLFIAAIDICQMTTFLAFAARKGIALKTYTSEGKGMLEFVEGGYRFTRVTLSPAISVAQGTDLALVAELVRDAHEHCLIGRSVTAIVEIVPHITAG